MKKAEKVARDALHVARLATRVQVRFERAFENREGKLGTLRRVVRGKPRREKLAKVKRDAVQGGSSNLPQSRCTRDLRVYSHSDVRNKREYSPGRDKQQ